MQVVRWNGTMWKDHGNGGTTGTIAGGTIGSSGAVTSFSPFTLASQNVDNPLPVELLSFKVEDEKDGVALDWTTASEVNNHYFTVERSTDLVSFEEVVRVNGAGNSNGLKQYAALDSAPLEGISYYRLVQIDYDGTRREYDPQMVQFKVASEQELQVFPNPFEERFSLRLQGIEDGIYQLSITDAAGMLIGTASLSGSDLAGYEINLKDKMPGVYTIQIYNAKMNLVKRVIKRS